MNLRELKLPPLLCGLGASSIPFGPLSTKPTQVKGVIMSLALHYWMGDVHHCSGPPVSEMTFTVSSGTLNHSIPTIPYQALLCVCFGGDILPTARKGRLISVWKRCSSTNTPVYNVMILTRYLPQCALVGTSCLHLVLPSVTHSYCYLKDIGHSCLLLTGRIILLVVLSLYALYIIFGS